MNGSLAKKERVGIIMVLLIALLITAVLLFIKSPLSKGAPSEKETAAAMDTTLTGGNYSDDNAVSVLHKEKRANKKSSGKRGRKKSSSGKSGGSARSGKSTAPAFRDMEADTLYYPQ